MSARTPNPVAVVEAARTLTEVIFPDRDPVEAWSLVETAAEVARLSARTLDRGSDTFADLVELADGVREVSTLVALADAYGVGGLVAALAAMRDGGAS